MAFGTQTQKQERDRETGGGTTFSTTNFVILWTSFLSRSCEKGLYNSESAKKIFGWCFGFFFFCFFVFVPEWKRREALREGGREEELAGGELDNGVTSSLSSRN